MEGKDVNPRPPSPESPNTTTVRRLYTALSGGRKDISALVASDLDWWFHGPENCHYMMKMLTGKSSPSNSIRFDPRSIDEIDGDRVIVEGWDGPQVYWVHVWTFNKHGVITQFREYFNSWLTVINDVKRFNSKAILWRSHPRDFFKRSLPGLMLAI